MHLVNVSFSILCKYSLYDHHQLKYSLSASNRLSNGCLVGRLIDAFLGLIECRWLFPGEWNVCMGKYECKNEMEMWMRIRRRWREDVGVNLMFERGICEWNYMLFQKRKLKLQALFGCPCPLFSYNSPLSHAQHGGQQ